jgi:beta-glucosidase
MNIFKKISLIFVISINLINAQEDLSRTEIRWNWNQIEPINTNDLKFPNNFLWGVATSAHQVEGNCNCQWTHFEKIKNVENSGIACDHANKYKEDISLMKDLGVNSYRFSIEWSKVEPVQGFFNKEEIQRYSNIIDELIKNNIKPVITLHHFTHPQWFEARGAFENEQNIEYFVRFCKRMFNEYSDRVQMWCTINEPGVYVFQGYVRAVFPPAKTSLDLAGIVSLNLIKAHIETYKSLKKLPNGQQAQIGICHSITHFDAFHQGNLLEEFIAKYTNHIFFDAMMQFFITGKFHFSAPKLFELLFSKLSLLNKLSSPIKLKMAFVPIALNIFTDLKYEYNNDQGIYNASDIMDFIGIQPYSHCLIDYTNSKAETIPSLRPGDIPTDMPYCIYPETLYRAVNQASFIGVPIYITENGISDVKDDRRELFIKRYIYAMHKAIKDGYDIRGYFYWSLLDNFEWDMGYKQKFGLYEVDFMTQERKLRKGAEVYQLIVKQNNQ